jgi:hypothetical protein
MTDEPFRDSLIKLSAAGKDWQAMSYESNKARSHSWFRNMVEYGAWGVTSNRARVGPPTPDEFEGLAKLLGTTSEQVASMVVSDFYRVDTGNGFSARMQRLSPIVDSLAEADAELIENTARRLGTT